MRKSVRIFADEMERVLKENDYKGGWQDCLDRYLFQKLNEEVREVEREYWRGDERHAFRGDAKKLRKELVDVANVCMMLHENIGRDSACLEAK